VYIFDGATQVTYPDLAPTSGAARWKLTGQYSYYYGSAMAVGDVDNDGYEDLIVGDQYNGGYTPYTGYIHLYYGGPQWNSKTTVSFSGSDARFMSSSTSSYMYVYGANQILADLDADGYDDILGVIPYNYAAYWWYGKSTRFSGTITSYDATATGGGSYFGGNMAMGDVNNDGRDDIAFGCAYTQSTVYVMYPTSSIRSSTSYTVGSTTTGCSWQIYRDSTAYTSYYGFGLATNIGDVNNDGIVDLIFPTTYKTTTSNLPCLNVVYGKSSMASGTYDVSKVADVKFTSSECTNHYYAPAYFGSSAIGDYNGNGINDLMIGCSNPGRVYIVLDDVLASATGTIDIKNTAILTVKAPTGSSTYFAMPGYYPQYYWYYTQAKTIIFWDRDNDGTEEIFISDSQCSVGGKSQVWTIWGICSYDMISVSSVDIMNGDLPDYKTYYAEYTSYGVSATIYNKWNPTGTDSIKFKFTMGPFMAEYTYKKGIGIEETSDVLSIMEVDSSKLNITYDLEAFEMTVKMYFKFTLNMSNEYQVNLETFVQIAHIKYQVVKELGYVRHNFKYVGEMHAYLYDITSSTRIRELELGEWIPEDQMIEFAGPKLVYNGTENFMNEFGKEPFYPADRLFKILGSSSLYDEVYDDSSSGRGFNIIMRAGDLPILMDYKFEQVGIPTAKVLNSIPGFYVSVDIDTPGIPAGVRIHADAFDDDNTMVDNEGELYITWGIPAEYNSGIDHYEVTVTGISDPLETSENFVKVDTPSEGDIVASIKAFDRVGHVGLPGMGTIKIERQGLSFTNAVPAAGTWHNSYAPDVGYAITDEGGRFVIGTTVEYAVSLDGGETWGPWTNAGNTLSAVTIRVIVNPVLSEGDSNMVRFRAQDEAGNVAESGPITVNVDVSGLEFSDVRMDGDAEWLGDWIDSPEAVVSFHIEDTFSGVNASTVEYRYTTRSRSDLELTAWTKAGVIVGEDGTVTLPAIEFGMGDRNHLQFRGRDLAGNAFTYSKAYNIWVNTLPVAVMSSPEDGIEVLDQTMIRFDGTLSRDYDGDALTYTWIDTVGGVESIIETGSDDPARFDLALAVGEHTIKLKVSDGIHEVETDPVTVIVSAIVVQEWLSPVEDKDGDGLSNLYEFIYHLGWNDASNKDTAYEIGYWGKDRTEIKDLIGDSVATTENDFDGDGYTDYKEWLYDTNPTDVNDFPKFTPKGSPGPEAVDTLLIVLIVIAIIVIVAVIVVLALNSMAIRRKLSEEAAQAAQEEQVHVQRLLEGGGNQKLAALKAASEGRAVLSLPSPLTAQSALPMGEPVPAATMVQPVQPVAATPAGWVAAPAAEPSQSSQYANINSGTNVPPN
jgi:hypothetical protein